MISFLVAQALSAPTYEITALHTSGEAPALAADGESPSTHLWGLGGAVGWQWADRFGADITLRTGLDVDSSLLTTGLVRPQLLIGDLDGARVVIQPGVGVLRDTSIDTTPRPALSMGVGADLLKGPGVRPRVGLAYYGTPGQPARLELSVGVARWGRAPEPEPEPVALPTIELPKNASVVWVAQPTCRWMPANEALPSLRDRLSPDAEVPFVAALAAMSPLGHAESPGAGTSGGVAKPEQGVLVVAALPGDEVWVDDEAVTPSPEGLVMLSRASGRSDVRIRGAGRDVASPVGVVAGSTVWLQVDELPPLTHQVGFTQGSSDLDPAAQEVVTSLGAALGNWEVELEGGYSAEGNRQANERLATQRAESVRDRLVDAGVPLERIAVGPPRAPDPSLPPEQQRTTTLTLVPMEVTQ